MPSRVPGAGPRVKNLVILRAYPNGGGRVYPVAGGCAVFMERRWPPFRRVSMTDFPDLGSLVVSLHLVSDVGVVLGVSWGCRLEGGMVCGVPFGKLSSLVGVGVDPHHLARGLKSVSVWKRLE